MPLSALSRFAGAAPVIVRIVVGVVMFTHGWGKLMSPGGPAGFGAGLAERGIPLASVLGYLVTYGEVVGGVALILGLLTRLAALGLSLILIGALYVAKLRTGVGLVNQATTGAELELALLAGMFTLMLQGPGRLSLDHLFRLERAGRRGTPATA